MTLTHLPTIKKILSRQGFEFAKRLGQNFVVDPSICPRMAQLAQIDGENVLEIGPGIGVLTAELARRARKVLAVEIDKKLLPVLKETLGEWENVTICQGDILKIDLSALLSEHFSDSPKPLHVCANLPYYITSPIIMRLLESRLPFESLTLLVQKEAAWRICAPMGTRESGAITAAVNYFAKPELLFSVPASSFYPAPKVESAVMRLKIHKTPAVDVADEERFFAVIKAAFGQRRKTILNALGAGLNVTKAQVAAALEQANISPTARAEELSLEDFARLRV
ncbi:MAG: 16S rRNA (adenine(1518)-N(6)/adenine(1519)-N(6))-dimethyltransferase RsmA [Oscillospiraceae bacterium]|nr:16S rRNA (adenine(1518)-N(6)/adenine(1519)-N(6))-dimethyltransferase RsmA [Oscillospiraceae bacterium]